MAAALAVLLSAALVGCTPSRADDQSLTVLAAASLTGPFTEIAREFEAEHPGTRVRLSFGGSSALAEQVRAGAPADVLASAAPEPMDALAAAGLVEGPVVFARNHLVVAVPRDNPGQVKAVTDLPDATVALCQAEVPCGRAATRLLDSAGVELTPVTLEADVKAVLTKVGMGEVDAGLVYATDVRASAGKVTAIDLPPGVGATTDYPIATVGSSERAEIAQQFVSLVRSDKGRQILDAAGFEVVDDD